MKSLHRFFAFGLMVSMALSSCAGKRRIPGEVAMLKTMAEWNEFIESASRKNALIFKHSTSCPISAKALQEFQDFTQNSPLAKELEIAMVRVIEERPISQEIASRVGVKHASPQILYLVKGEVKWHASHFSITKGSIESAIKQPTD
jgi:bacillithiol system protein YtxJ